MEQEIIESLQLGNVDRLCEVAGVLPFQAYNIINEYQTIEQYETKMIGLDTSNLLKQKWDIINGLNNGQYANEDVQKKDFKNQIIKLLQTTNVKGLCDLTALDEEYILSIVEQFNTIEQYETEMIGLDTSNLLKQKWDIINELESTFDTLYKKSGKSL